MVRVQPEEPLSPLSASQAPHRNTTKRTILGGGSLFPTLPHVDTAAPSNPRGNGKSRLAAHLLTRAFTPGDELHEDHGGDVPAGEPDPLEALRSDLAKLRGGLAMLETTAGGWGDKGERGWPTGLKRHGVVGRTFRRVQWTAEEDATVLQRDRCDGISRAGWAARSARSGRGAETCG